MRITKYTTYLDEDRKPILVKEKSNNYPDVCSLNNPKKIVDMMNAVYNASMLTEEYVWVVALNTKCKPIGIFEVSHGTINESFISPREIFMKLCLCGAVSFVVIHNHPSGDCDPSNADIEMTKKIKQCSELMNITMNDHIIIGDNYYSFMEDGQL